MWLWLALAVLAYFVIRWYRERQTVDNLREKHVLITGCDSGFGNQLARQLDLLGLRVLAACLTQEGADKMEEVTSDRLKTTILDVTSTESVAAATEWVKEQVGLWGLVNNAGILLFMGPNEWLTKDNFKNVLEVNLLGAVDVTLHLLPLLRKAQGRVVNVSSIAGRVAYSGGGYSPSKFALEAFSDSLRRELRPFGVKVSIIEPGNFQTGIKVLPPTILWKKLPAEIRELYGVEYLNNCEPNTEQIIVTYHDMHLVTDCMEHALISRYPRTRYAAGWDSKFIFIPLSYLPASWVDYITTYSGVKPAKALY
uniref:Uncharacterized protein n=1 Tax=Varanus komodoensis TaxID=61221 RepID=A0A8D2Q6Y8_VARKO